MPGAVTQGMVEITLSSDRAFQRNGHERLGFHRKLHRQGLQNVLHKAVHHQRHRLFFVHPARAAVEQLIIINL